MNVKLMGVGEEYWCPPAKVEQLFRLCAEEMEPQNDAAHRRVARIRSQDEAQRAVDRAGDVSPPDADPDADTSPPEGPPPSAGGAG
jgi:hypothetical protein